MLHSIKSFTAHEINKLNDAAGPVWENESFDRMIRGEADLEEKFHYVCRNPWDSGVVSQSEDYPWLWTPEAAARDARQGDRDGRAPQPSAAPSAEQLALDIAFRVIADHIRTLSFAIADGIQPGNTDRNYVLRRILRRAVRYGRTLGFHEPFFYKLVSVLSETMGDVFPEIRKKQEHVEETIQREEEAFNRTLDRGIELFNEIADKTSGSVESLSRKKGEIPAFPAEQAFKLYDTYGFPLDLTQLMARERGSMVDVVAFDKMMEEQKALARASQVKQVIELSKVETTTPTQFVGYEKLESPAKVLEVVSAKDKTGVILDTSPLYADRSATRVNLSGAASSGTSRTHKRPVMLRCTSLPTTTRPTLVPKFNFPWTARVATPFNVTTPSRICCTGRCTKSLARTPRKRVPTSAQTN